MIRYRVERVEPLGFWPRVLALAFALAWAAFLLAGFVDAREGRRMRPACDAHGGTVVRLESGWACLWAGAVIPLDAPPYTRRAPAGEPTEGSPTR